jgi:TadE-like protein
MIKPIKKLKSRNREKAQTMLEFALVLPLVLLITYGIMEVGRAIFIYAAVNSAAREGARYGIAAGPGPNGIVQFADCQGIRAAIQKTAFLVTIPEDTIDIDYDHGSGSSFLSCPYPQISINPKLINLGDRIKVTVRARYDPVIGKFLGIGGYDITKTNYRTILLNIIQ